MASDELVWAGFRAVMRARRLIGDPLARLMAPGARADPYPEYARVRARGPLVATISGSVTADHAICGEVLRDAERFSNDPDGRRGPFRSRPPDPAAPPGPLGHESIIGMDSPDHDRVRRVAGRAFSRRAVERLRPRVEEAAGRLLDELDTDGPVNLIGAYAGVLPVVMISELLGIPADHHAQVKRWGDDLAITLDLSSPADTRRSEAAVDELHAYLAAVFAERRSRPGELVIDSLLAAEGAGSVSNRELMATSMLLLAAGFETTVNLIGNGALALLRHPEQCERLRGDPGLLASAVQEMLRYDAPVQVDGRRVMRDTELAGHRVRAGRSVVMLLGGANRDPTVFPDPDVFDVGRPDAAAHLAFAAGPHYCIGAALARLEAEVAFGALLERFPRWRAAGPPSRRHGLTLRGLTTLPVELSRSRIPA